MKTIRSRATITQTLILINKAKVIEAKSNLELTDTIPNAKPPIKGVWVYNGMRYVLAKN